MSRQGRQGGYTRMNKQAGKFESQTSFPRFYSSPPMHLPVLIYEAQDSRHCRQCGEHQLAEIAFGLNPPRHGLPVSADDRSRSHRSLEVRLAETQRQNGYVGEHDSFFAFAWMVQFSPRRQALLQRHPDSRSYIAICDRASDWTFHWGKRSRPRPKHQFDGCLQSPDQR